MSYKFVLTIFSLMILKISSRPPKSTLRVSKSIYCTSFPEHIEEVLGVIRMHIDTLWGQESEILKCEHFQRLVIFSDFGDVS